MARVSLLLLVLLVSACATAPAPTIAPKPERQVVQERLTAHLEADPNHEMCATISSEFKKGNRDALVPFFDTASFVERVGTRRTLPTDMMAELRENHDTFQNFARVHFQEGSDFLCLGTRDFLGEPHIVIRQWKPTRFDYLLLHLTNGQIDDYFIVSGGFYQSDLQAHAFDPAFSASMKVVTNMLQKSYKNDFASIITDYQNLPVDAQQLPIAFFHYINAVFIIEPTGSTLYTESLHELDRIMAGRVYTLAYWHRIDAKRQDDPAAAAVQSGILLTLLDDYELLSN